MMRGKIKYVAGVLLFFAGAMLFYQKIFIARRQYKTVSPVRGTMTLQVSGIGEVSAKSIYNISSQSGGILKDIYRDQGDHVKKGEILALIDPVDLDEKLAEAEAAYGRALLEIEATEKEHTLNEEQHSLALQTFNRMERLYRKEQVAEIEYDRAKTDMLTSRTRMEGYAYRIASAKAEARRLHQAVRGLEAQLATLEIRSPVDGFVIAREAEPTETVLPSRPILKIVDKETLWIKAYIDERLSGNVDKGQQARIRLRSRPGSTFTGQVVRVDAVSDAVTEERIVYVAFHEAPQSFFINEQALVDIQVKTLSDVLKIPSSLLVDHEGQKGVWLANGSRAYFKKLHIVAQNDEEVAVGSIITEGSRILVPETGKLKLSEGMTVRL